MTAESNAVADVLAAATKTNAQSLHAWLALALELLDSDVPQWGGSTFATVDKRTLASARKAVRRELAQHELRADEIAEEFERYLSDVDSGSSSGRRNSGAYFTPPDLIDLVVEQTLLPVLDKAKTADDILSLRVFDVAVGAGGFLLSAARVLAERLEDLSPKLSLREARKRVVESCLFGVDINPLAVLLTRANLACYANGAALPENRVFWADTILPISSSQTTNFGAPPFDPAPIFDHFGGKFDVVIGNPPWGAVKPAVREYFSFAGPDALGLQGAELRRHIKQHRADKEWSAHADEIRRYAQLLRESTSFLHQGRGDADLYRYFVERAHQLVRSDGGRIGLLVPAAVLRADGATALRRLLMSTGTFESVFEFVNSDHIFDIHSMFRFVMAVWRAGRPRGIERVHFGLHSVAEANKALDAQPAAMSLNFVRNVSGRRLSIPDVRSRKDARLLTHLYKLHPTLEETGCEWTPQFVREMDMTNDSHHFISASRAARSKRKLFPLYEGRMVHQFDNRAKRYEGGAARRSVWMAQTVGTRDLAPHFYVPETVVRSLNIGFARAGFCDVTGHANERTVLSAIIPANAVAGNKVPTIRFDLGDRDLHFIWLALANSFVIDWIARRRVATSLNFFQLEQLPFPRIMPASDLGQQMTSLAKTLSSKVTRWTTNSLRERAATRAQLDAIVASVFDLQLDELVLLLKDFPLLDRYQPNLPRASRSTITRDLVLQSYASHLQLGDISLNDLKLPRDGGPELLSERVECAHTNGQIAYIPGEHAKALWQRR